MKSVQSKLGSKKKERVSTKIGRWLAGSGVIKDILRPSLAVIHVYKAIVSRLAVHEDY